VDPASILFLTSERGREALDAARETRGAEPLARRRALEARMPGLEAAEARATLAQDDLRVRAAAKTPLADVLLFQRKALEQASSHVVAAERARRFASFQVVADLGAGIGLDTIALAAAVERVVAVERDPVRAALLRWNVSAAGVADRVTVVEGDAVDAAPVADAAFLDPDRRPQGKRTLDPTEFAPAPAAWAALAARYRNLLVKLAPATRPQDVPEAALEWVSLAGEMKEARLGFGRLAIPAPPSTGSGPAARRALLLPQAIVVEGTGIAWPPPREPKEGDVLLDPDPAVVLAGLVGDAATPIGAQPVHPRIAYLLADRPMPWARSLRVHAVLPADAATIRRALDERGVGDVEVRTRGVEDGAEVWRRRIGTRAGRRGIVVVTRGPDDRYRALLAAAV
jgi:hypothetical protein